MVDVKTMPQGLWPVECAYMPVHNEYRMQFDEDRDCRGKERSIVA